LDSDFGLRTLDFGLRTTDYGHWTTDYGDRTTDFELWTTDCGLKTSDYGLRATYLDPLLAQEVGGGVQHVRGVRGVVVGVGGVVAALDHLQPGAQRGLGAVEELADAHPREDLQAQVGQRPVGWRRTPLETESMPHLNQPTA